MRELIERALREDIGDGDVTTGALAAGDARARATIVQKAPGVIAGLEVAEATFDAVDPGLEWRALVEEGQWRDGGPVATIEGPTASILKGERVALNFLGRLSGVATLTARFVHEIDGTGAQILDTRKTTPGLRELEKRAVVVGGGHNHRAGLYDAILVKENHAAAAGGVGEATRRALAAADARRGARALGGAPGPRDGLVVEVECASLAELDEALAAGAPMVLLDNMAPDELREAVERTAGRAELEASGGVTLETVRAIAETGVDYVSVGALTHSAPALDLSLRVDSLDP
ncbi:MAG: carboxylating nicotinate-nucleotide diphosphorylase [Actinobacteria bacterium]|nr:carboxylating nicotinate-nucleotide diphosphorylase [Actinomycetota bacterium]